MDFSGLRPVLAQLLGWTSARGWPPFDPVSLFLLHGWQLTNGWSRSETLRHLRDPRYADYAHRFGFIPGIFPTEDGLRYFLTALGQPRQEQDLAILLPTDPGQEPQQVALHRLNYLLAQSVSLFVQHGFVSPAAWQAALLCPDGLIQWAASRLRCAFVTATCYQPTSPTAPRPCAARTAGQQGCVCDTAACAQSCRFAPPRDPAARVVVYRGSNQPPDHPNQNATPPDTAAKPGQLYYGYRSLPLQLADPQCRFSLVLLDHFQSAEAREERPATAELCALALLYPTLHVAAVAGDAGFGYDLPLHTIYAVLHARRVVDLRGHETDRDQTNWPVRGYDDHGRPLCAYGYAFTANGFDPRVAPAAGNSDIQA